jgi:hypothetical protein
MANEVGGIVVSEVVTGNALRHCENDVRKAM